MAFRMDALDLPASPSYQPQDEYLGDHLLGDLPGMAPRRPLPRIDADEEDLAVVTAEAWSALREANDPPRLFRHGVQPSRIEPDDESVPVERPSDRRIPFCS
jgi:hypothetical protein